MDTPITRAEYEGFRRAMEVENKRLSDEDKRQNRRIDSLEEDIKEMHELMVTVGKMSTTMGNVLKEIKRYGDLIEKQNSRIEKIEDEPAENYKQIKISIVTSIISTVIGAAVTAAAAFIAFL